MWKTQLNKSVQELRFVLKQSPDHNGVWRFIETKLPELRILNQNTFFSIAEINDKFKTKSSCHFIYGDVMNTEEAVLTSGLSAEEFEKILKEKVAYGLTLERLGAATAVNNDDRDLPVDIVESHKFVRYMDDAF